MKKKVKNYKNGEVRIISKFLWFPKTMQNLTTGEKEFRWLERASWAEEYDGGWGDSHWGNLGWVDSVGALVVALLRRL